MKKLFFASIVMLAMTTSCNNETSTTAPEEQQKQTFVGKTTTREGEELPPLTVEQEREMIADAIEVVKESLQTSSITGKRKSIILCQKNYNGIEGHACVYNGGYLVYVTWEPDYPNTGSGPTQTPPDPNIIYHGQIVNKCNC